MPNQELETLPASLQSRAMKLRERVSEYQEQQQNYLQAKAETARLRESAAALDAEAEEANSTWKAMAMQRTAEQKKINAEIERCARLKEQAGALQRTAEVREELHAQLVVGLAEKRFGLNHSVDAINRDYQAHMLESLLATPGLKDTLSKIYSLTRRKFLDQYDSIESVLYRKEGQAETEINHQFIQALGLDTSSNAPQLASVPAPVSGEIVATGRIALERLKKEGGTIPLQAWWPGLPASKPAPGLVVTP